jgi:gluconokinase
VPTSRATVVTCSALRRAYRDVLREADGHVRFVYLSGDVDLIGERIGYRKGHFMPSSLLKSQFETLEPLESDEDGFAVDVAQDPERVADTIIKNLTVT